ncbi:MAG: hypothetical protein ABI548_10835 [Polyangiaceae bacterium]
MSTSHSEYVSLKLAAEQVVNTATRLERRIEERFPGAGLSLTKDH